MYLETKFLSLPKSINDRVLIVPSVSSTTMHDLFVNLQPRINLSEVGQTCHHPSEFNFASQCGPPFQSTALPASRPSGSSIGRPRRKWTLCYRDHQTIMPPNLHDWETVAGQFITRARACRGDKRFIIWADSVRNVICGDKCPETPG